MTHSLNERVAAEVRAELGRQRLSVNEFAKRLHWTQPYAQRRMSGDVPLDLNDIEHICRELGIPVASLVTDSPVRAVS